jgi:hypothetical protein
MLSTSKPAKSAIFAQDSRRSRRWISVKIRGERIALPIDGPLEEAAWMKERIARAKQALPDGHCGLPLV